MLRSASRPSVALAAALAAGPSACGDDDTAPPAARPPAPQGVLAEAPPAEAPLVEELPTAGAPPAAAYEPRPGPAYLGVQGVGLMRLEDGAFTLLVPHKYAFQQIVVDATGVVHATAIGGMWRVDGTRTNAIEPSNGLTYPAITLGPDGVLWATDRRGVSRYDGAWTHEPGATFDGGLLHDLAVDHDGRVWVLASDALWLLDGERWYRVDPAFAAHAPPHFRSIETGTDGAIYVSGMGATSVFRDGRWARTPLDAGRPSTPFDELVVGPAGHVVGTTGVDTLVVAAPGEPVRRTRVSHGPARAARANVRAVDGAGRVWLATDNGLAILDARGELVQQWQPGTVAGIDGDVTAVAVVGDGPTLPPLRPAVTGTITGTLVHRGGRPIAGGTVQLCDLPLTMFRATPCETATYAALATTDAAGRFRLERVPVGSYGVAVKGAGPWRVLFDVSCCSALASTDPLDVGALLAD